MGDPSSRRFSIITNQNTKVTENSVLNFENYTLINLICVDLN